jgi:glycosyltransferase involved in cell wall biosynthesis
LSGALRRLHDDVELRDVLGRRARARVTRLYSLRTRADDLLQIYRDLCDGVAQVA